MGWNRQFNPEIDLVGARRALAVATATVYGIAPHRGTMLRTVGGEAVSTCDRGPSA